MKVSKLVALGLVSLTVAGLGAGTAHAAPESMDDISAKTTGKITFYKGDGVNPGVTDPEEGGEIETNKPGPGGESNVDDPDLKIMFVPNFVFGEYDKDGKNFKENVRYDISKTNVFYAWDQNISQLEKDPNTGEVTKYTPKTMSNFVQIFNSNKISNWELQVERGPWKSSLNPNDERNWIINVNNIVLADRDDKEENKGNYGPQAELLSANTSDGFNSIEIGTGAKPFAKYDQSKAGALQGAKNSFMFYPTQAGPTFSTAKDAAKDAKKRDGVTLTIPVGESINYEKSQTFTTDLTWTLTSIVKDEPAAPAEG